jgi:hypothetical protein
MEKLADEYRNHQFAKSRSPQRSFYFFVTHPEEAEKVRVTLRLWNDGLVQPMASPWTAQRAVILAWACSAVSPMAVSKLW